jgi:hypothetical protein
VSEDREVMWLSAAPNMEAHQGTLKQATGNLFAYVALKSNSCVAAERRQPEPIHIFGSPDSPEARRAPIRQAAE